MRQLLRQTHAAWLGSLLLISLFLMMSCLAVEKPTVTLTAIQKQEAAKWYFKKKDYEKAAELCEAAIASWERVEKAKLKVTPDWNIEFNIVQCRELLNKCKTRMAFVDEDKAKLK